MIYRSPWPSVSIPQMSLPAFILQQADKFGDKPALIEGSSARVITYRQLKSAINSCAAGLAERGFGKGDIFAIASPNSPEFAIAFYAVALLGGIATPINPMATSTEMTGQLVDSGAKYLMTTPETSEKALKASEGTRVEMIFAAGDVPGISPLSSLASNKQPPQVQIHPDKDIVALPYSSGTTGLPKGVKLSHFNLVANLCQLESLERITADDTLIGLLPFFHIYGMTVVLNSGLYRGATIVTMSRFDLPGFLHILQTYSVTRAHLVPPTLLALAKQPIVGEYDLSHLKIIVSGAAPLDKSIAKACADRLGCVIKQGYGLTESSPVTHINPDPPDLIKPGAVGPSLPNTEYQIVDPQTRASFGPQKQGEVLVRGPQVMKGYWHRPDATNEVLDNAGWLRTGDIGYADEDGYLYIVDRIKELIKYKGYHVAPAELEAVLLTHPAIADAAVIPSQDEQAGEVPKAYIVLKEDINKNAIMAYVAERVASYKKVRQVEFVNQIPRSSSGKILRRVLIDHERQQSKKST